MYMEKLKNICDIAIKWIFGIVFFLVLLGIFNGSFGVISAIIVLAGAIYVVSRFDISHKKFLIITCFISYKNSGCIRNTKSTSFRF